VDGSFLRKKLCRIIKEKGELVLELTSLFIV
jgi:hypothetical protein